MSQITRGYHQLKIFSSRTTVPNSGRDMVGFGPSPRDECGKQKTNDLEEDLMLTRQNYPTCWEISVHILRQTGVWTDQFTSVRCWLSSPLGTTGQVWGCRKRSSFVTSWLLHKSKVRCLASRSSFQHPIKGKISRYIQVRRWRFRRAIASLDVFHKTWPMVVAHKAQNFIHWNRQHQCNSYPIFHLSRTRICDTTLSHPNIRPTIGRYKNMLVDIFSSISIGTL